MVFTMINYYQNLLWPFQRLLKKAKEIAVQLFSVIIWRNISGTTSNPLKDSNKWFHVFCHSPNLREREPESIVSRNFFKALMVWRNFSLSKKYLLGHPTPWLHVFHSFSKALRPEDFTKYFHSSKALNFKVWSLRPPNQ